VILTFSPSTSNLHSLHVITNLILTDSYKNPSLVSVIVPLSDQDSFTPTFKNAEEVIVVREGWSPGEARNIGAGRAKGSILLFVDADMDLNGLDISSLNGPWDLATAFYSTDSEWDRYMVELRNLTLLSSSPLCFWGGFIWVKKAVFDRLKGFRLMEWEDIDFAIRAWLSGFKLGFFNITVRHTRPFKFRLPFNIFMGRSR